MPSTKNYLNTLSCKLSNGTRLALIEISEDIVCFPELGCLSLRTDGFDSIGKWFSDQIPALAEMGMLFLWL